MVTSGGEDGVGMGGGGEAMSGGVDVGAAAPSVVPADGCPAAGGGGEPADPGAAAGSTRPSEEGGVAQRRRPARAPGAARGVQPADAREGAPHHRRCRC